MTASVAKNLKEMMSGRSLILTLFVMCTSVFDLVSVAFANLVPVPPYQGHWFI
jgi:hypothetical protein